MYGSESKISQFTEKKLKQRVLNKDRKNIEKEIPKLTEYEHREIFNIIRNSKTKYSENSTGIYINLKFINNETLLKITNFINYSKNSIKNTSISKVESNKNNDSTDISEKYSLDKESIFDELVRLKNKNKEHFTFQNFLDKLSISNIKQFNISDQNVKIIYPQLFKSDSKFEGVLARLLKTCRDVNKVTYDLPFVPSDIQQDIDEDYKIYLNKENDDDSHQHIGEYDDDGGDDELDDDDLENDELEDDGLEDDDIVSEDYENENSEDDDYE